MARRSAVLGLAALLSIVPSRASAVPIERVAFLGLRSLGLADDEVVLMSHVVDDALAQAPSLTRTAALSQAERCGSESFCYCDAARTVDASHVLFGNLGRIDPVYSIELVLLDTQNCTVEGTVFVSEQHTLASAATRLRELVAGLLVPSSSVSETVVKDARDVRDVPAVVTVITAKEIEQLGITELAEIFRLVPGFETMEMNFGTDVLHQGLAGTLLFMIDGEPLSIPVWAFQTLGRDFQISVDQIERVELVRGPGSVLWGGWALLGIVNIITRGPGRETPRVLGHLRYGTLDTEELHASVDANHGAFGYYFGATASRTRGPKSWVADSSFGFDASGERVWGNSGWTRNGADHYYDFVGKLRLFGKLELNVDYLAFRNLYQISPGGALLTPELQGIWDKRHVLTSIAWEDRLPYGLRYRLSAFRHESYFWERLVGYPPNGDVSPLGLVYRQGNRTEPQVNQLFEARLYHELELEKLGNQLLAGASYFSQHLPDNYVRITDGSDPGQRQLDLEAHTATTISAYVQDELALIGDRLLASGGVRYDDHRPFKSTLTKQAALIGKVRGLFGKIIYAEGFRPPDFNSLYATQGVQGNPHLRPERSRALSLQGGADLKPLYVTLGGSRGSITDLIRLRPIVGSTDPAVSDEPVNLARIDFETLFAEARIEWSSLLSTYASYAYKTLDESAPIGRGIPVAAHTASLTMSVRPAADVNTFATLAAVSSRRVTVLTYGDVEIRQTVPAHYVLDVGATVYNIRRAVDVTVKVHNPLGESYEVPYYLDGSATRTPEVRDARELMLTLRWSL